METRPFRAILPHPALPCKLLQKEQPCTRKWLIFPNNRISWGVEARSNCKAAMYRSHDFKTIAATSSDGFRSKWKMKVSLSSTPLPDKSICSLFVICCGTSSDVSIKASMIAKNMHLSWLPFRNIRLRKVVKEPLFCVHHTGHRMFKFQVNQTKRIVR